MNISKKITPFIKKSRIEWAKSDEERDAGLTEPEDIVQYKNISYGKYGVDNLLDIYIPNGIKEEKKPVLINIHGGGYFYGDKELYRFYAMDMARYGFIVINMNYRLSPENVFPAALEDINETIKFVEAHFHEYGMDIDRVFLMGDSAGAQLASHYAAMITNPQFASLYDFAMAKIKIRGISLACGMYDIPREMQSDNKELYRTYLGDLYGSKHPKLDVCAAITDEYPTTYIFSCPNDFLYDRCEPMAKLIQERGARAVMKIYGTADMKEVGHVFHCNMKLAIGAQARKEQAEFLMSL